MFQRRRVLASIGLVATMAVAAAAPTTAAAKTRWVDDDGKAGPTSCAGTAVAPKTVQPAIKASAASDTVKVCPGTYTGRLAIQGARDGLKLLAATSTKPVLQVAPTAATSILSVTGVDDVQVKGFTLRSNSADACDGARTGIQVDGAKRLTLKQLRLEATGTATLTGCALSTGISLADSTATIAGVRIVNPSSNAIYAYGTSTVTVTNATADYLHAAETGSGAGIMFKLQGGAKGSLKHLTINGLASALTSTTPRLNTAVQVDTAGAGVTVEDVTTTYARIAVKIAFSNTVTVTGVTATDATTAVILDSGTGANVSGVTSPGSENGIRVVSATGATIHDNDLTGASVFGCEDETTGGTGTLGTQNTWTSNLTSTTSNPSGLCSEP